MFSTEEDVTFRQVCSMCDKLWSIEWAVEVLPNVRPLLPLASHTTVWSLHQLAATMNFVRALRGDEIVAPNNALLEEED